MGSMPAHSDRRNYRPADGVFVRYLDGEAVVHVAASDSWHEVAAVGASILQVADGSRDVAAISAVTHLAPVEVEAALAELALQGMLRAPDGISRRTMLQRAALVGGATLTTTVLSSIQSPMAMAAASTTTNGGRYSIRSSTPGEDSLYVTRNSGDTGTAMVSQGYGVGPESLRERGTFVVRAGLNTGAAGSVSFESVSNPGSYLRHANYVVFVDPLANTDLYRADASFYLRDGLNGSGTSFEASNGGSLAGYYVRRVGAGLFLGKVGATTGPAGGGQNASANFNRDCTFFVSLPLAPATP